MAKLITNDLTNLQNDASATATLNNNFAAVETAVENTLSRDGTSPNTMGASLDMNGHQVINLPAPAEGTSPVRVNDLTAYIPQLNGTSTIAPSAGAGDVDKVVKVAGVGVLGYTDVIIDSSFNISPKTNDVGALGTTALKWQDLFLASGAVINFNSGDVTLTHAANTLTFGGASSGYKFDALIAPSANDGAPLGSTALTWSDIFLASGGVINFNSGDVTLTHAANLLTFAGASSGYSFDAVILPAANNTLPLGSLALNWADLFLGTGAVINFNNSEVTLTHSTNNLTLASTQLTLAAGTATRPTLKFTSGTNMTTTTAGAVEYDGKIFYQSGEANARSVNIGQHMLIVTSDQTGQNVNTVQNVFGQTSGASAFNAAATTSYWVEGLFLITRAAGTTSHTTSFALAGSATYTQSLLSYLTRTSTGATLTSPLEITSVNASTQTVLTGASTSATENLSIRINGVIKVNGAGTIVPQFLYSVAPGGAPTIVSGTYIKFTPIGTNSLASVGNWI